MNIKNWTSNERLEHEELMDEICDETVDPGARAGLLRERVRDAVQANRFWASELEEHVELTGYRQYANRWAQKRKQVTLHRQGRAPVTRSSVVGARADDGDGGIEYVQLDLADLTREQIEEGRRADLAMTRSYGDRIALRDAYLALLDLAPEASTPREAAAQIGTTVESWLGQEVA